MSFPNFTRSAPTRAFQRCPLRKRRGISVWLLRWATVGLPLVSGIAVAGDDDTDYLEDPCAGENPPAWCQDYEPPTTVYPQGTMQPDIAMVAESPPKEGPPLFLVGSTIVAPPPVLWLNGRPEDSSRVYGVGEAAAFVKAMELILPAGWTIWTTEDLAKLNHVVGDRVFWDGNGQPWPEVLEALAQQYGVEITADVLSRRAVVRLARRPEAAGPAVSRYRTSTGAGTEPEPYPGGRMLIGPKGTPSSARGSDHPLYRPYASPTKLSAEPLPDTIGRVAWRLAPVGVQIDLTALGAYVNAPVFQWDFTGSFVSPKAALAALMPTGYCVDESEFPIVRAVVCDEGNSTGDDPAGEENNAVAP